MSYLAEDKNQKFLDIPLLGKILYYAKDYKGTAILAFLTMIVSNFIPFLFPHILQIIIDGPIKEKNFPAILNWLTLYLSLILIQSGLGYFSSLLSKFLAFKTIHQLRKKLYARVQTYKIDFFHKTPIGRLMTRMTNDVDSLNSLFSEGLLDLFGAVLMIIFAVTFMFSKNWKLALTTVLLLPAMIIATSIFRVKVRNINRTIRAKLASLNATLQENLNGLFIVQLFSKQTEKFKLFEADNALYRDAYFKNVKYYSVFFPTLMTLSDLSLISCYAVGAYLIHNGETTTGTLIAFAWYASMFQRPLRDLSDKVTQLQSSIAAGERVFSLMEADAQEEDGIIELEYKPLSLAFKNVSFGYAAVNPVLKNLSFSIEAGKTFAIVGATGAGKSTIIHLINRFYQVDSGNIILGNTSLNDIYSKSLRPLIANVTQDVHLFNDTIANNLCLHLKIDSKKLWEVIDYCQLKGLVENLGGLEATLNPKNLSSGQRQLFSFARALYSNPQLLLLDEATSSVDTQTELSIQKALAHLLQNRTAIVVAHRLSTIVESDQILVMHQGELREQGTHLELIQQNGIYSKLVLLNNQDFTVKV